jgi:type II secretory ATPase GspE/PulE/Tfp pilus assembly ATPase PilB-like protein
MDFEPSNVDELADQLQAEQDVEHVEEKHLSENDTALTKLVNTMVQDAYAQGASDIHIETYPGNDPTVIRFRKDGDLQTYLELPASYRRPMIARIKIMATLDISERRKPQDGKIDFSKFGKIKLELRVATIPTTNGLEDVVMRLLASSKPVPLAKLGLSEYNISQVKTITERPYGIFLVCGPTGSGKTTTLHSCLAHINTPERKIWTAEDPVEITQRGLRQVQVNPKIGWTFADALRAFLRADPDVVMIGEMRDFETARIAIEASLTGHLVLSTLHTNSAPESIVRLLDFGLDPFNFSDALLGILAQRLVRRICPECRKATPARDVFIAELVEDYARHMPDDSPAARAALVNDWRGRFGDEQGRLREWRSPGCDACGGTGFKGRAGIHELLVANMEVKRLVQTKGRVEEVQLAASRNGMRTLRQDGIEKILQGVTELHEVRAASN